jgi:DNA replication licensing factor MCM7
VSVVAYTDPVSGYEVYQEVTGRTFRPLDNDPRQVDRGVGLDVMVE